MITTTPQSNSFTSWTEINKAPVNIRVLVCTDKVEIATLYREGVWYNDCCQVVKPKYWKYLPNKPH